MGYITINKVAGQMTGAINGKPFGLSYSDNRYKSLLVLQKSADDADSMEELNPLLEQARKLVEPDWNELVEHASTSFLQVNREKGTYHLHLRDTVSPVPMPQVLVNKIEDCISKGVDISPIIKAWTRLLRNEKFSLTKAAKFAWYISQEFFSDEEYAKLIDKGLNEETARQRATTLQVPLTMEGLLQTLKVSAELKTKFVKDGETVKEVSRQEWEVDEFTGLKVYKNVDYVEDRIFHPAVQGLTGGDAFWCQNIMTFDKTEGHLIRVGHIHFLDSWDKVNCNDNQSCVKGLHVGNYTYVAGYQNSGTLTHNVFVDPFDIGAIVQDGSGAIRVRRYMVWSSFAGVNKNLYNSSRYAQVNDAEYALMVQQAVIKSEKEFRDKTRELEALVTTIGYGDTNVPG